MENVKQVLQSWKHDLAHWDSLTGTEFGVDDKTYEDLEFMIEQLEEAIKMDENTARQNRIEEDEFNSHLNIQRYQL